MGSSHHTATSACPAAAAAAATAPAGIRTGPAAAGSAAGAGGAAAGAATQAAGKAAGSGAGMLTQFVFVAVVLRLECVCVCVCVCMSAHVCACVRGRVWIAYVREGERVCMWHRHNDRDWAMSMSAEPCTSYSAVCTRLCASDRAQACLCPSKQAAVCFCSSDHAAACLCPSYHAAACLCPSYHAAACLCPSYHAAACLSPPDHAASMRQAPVPTSSCRKCSLVPHCMAMPQLRSCASRHASLAACSACSPRLLEAAIMRTRTARCMLQYRASAAVLLRTRSPFPLPPSPQLQCVLDQLQT